MTAQEHLQKYGVSMQVARDFIFNNLDNLGFIFETCKQFGVTNNMIAEIINIGFTGNDVAKYFSDHGYNAGELDAAAPQSSGDIYPGISVYVESQQRTDAGNDGSIDWVTNYTYSYENGLLNQYADGILVSQLKFDSNGRMVEERNVTDNQVDATTYYAYNSKGQVIDMSGSSTDGTTIDSTFVWTSNGVTSTFTMVNGANSMIGKVVGIGLDSTQTAPLKVESYFDDELYTIDNYTYDAHGNEIKDIEDENADGSIDYVYYTDWILI